MDTKVTLLLNGVPQTLVFNTNGATRQLLATNTTPLATNVQYGATIIAVDANGNSATNSFGFDRFKPTRFARCEELWRDRQRVTLDTVAIQSAINACPPNGFVWLHNGTFLSETSL